MKEIKFREDLKGQHRNPIYIMNEEDIHFENGLAVIKSGQRTGVINSNFEELPGEMNKALMELCFWYNQRIERLGDYDFVTHNANYGTRHIRYKDEVASIISDNWKVKKTKMNNILISGKALYDMEIGEKISREFSWIEEVDENVFYVRDVIRTERNTKDLFSSLEEYLTFYMDISGNLLSDVVSSLEREPIHIDDANLNYETFRKFREMDLEVRFKELNENDQALQRALEIRRK